MDEGGRQAHDRTMNTANDVGSPPPPPPPTGPRLTRSSDDKVLSGLCGGLGRHFGVDPVVFRIAFVVLSLAGGSGLLLYLAGWALVPDDRTGASAFHHLGRGRSEQVVAAVVAGVGIVVLFDAVFDERDGGMPVGIVLVALGLLALWSRRDSAGPPRSTPPTEPPTSGPGDAPPPPTQPPTPPPGPPPPGDTPPLGTASPSPDPATPASPPTSSNLVPVTLSLLAVLTGGLALLDVSGAVDVTLTAGLALALLLVGGALLVAARWGRGRLLIPVGLALSAALVLASIVDVPFRGGAGDRDFRPRTLAQLQSPYRLGVGDLTVDLSALDLEGTTATVVATLAAGDLLVVVPEGAGLDLRAEVGAGNLEVLDRRDDGVGVESRVVERGREGNGRLVLRLRVGLGDLEVRHGPA